MLRILIVDDEPAAATILRILLEKHTVVLKEIAVCHSAREAIDVVKVFQPDLVMLDVEMPHLNGFDFLNNLVSRDFDVIFVTAFDKYAIKAIRFSALDFILKPIDITDLENAVNRHLSRKENRKSSNEQITNLIRNLQQKDIAGFKIALSTLEGLHFHAPSEILRCEGADNYTHFYFLNGYSLLVSRTLKEFEDILSDHGFVRVHKSHLVNIAEVTKLDRSGFLWLSDGKAVPVSRRKKDHLLKLIK